MIVTQIKDDRLKEQKLQFIRTHQEAFDVQPIYRLRLFEEFVTEAEGDCIIEASCKVELDKLIASRLVLFFQDKAKNWKEYLNQSLAFFRQVESRVGVRLNYSLLQQFLGHNFDFSKVQVISAGIDLRGNLAESNLKMHIRIEDYPEKLKTAFSLSDGASDNYLSNFVSLIGFDFYFNGESEIEIYPEVKEEDFSKPEVQHLVQRYFPKSLNPLQISKSFIIGFSKANNSPVLYYLLEDRKTLSNYFNLNDTAQRVHNFYQHQENRPEVWVGVTKEELEKTRIDNVRLYYHKSFIADE
ncbi:MAG: DUF5838 family protein [Cyanobacteria bacterium J06635_10]